jgi:hypothetical protein
MSILGGIGGAALGGIVQTVGNVIDDLHTSDEERQAAELESRKEDNKLLLAQTEINKVEAAHPSMFVAGWRPGAGWVCVVALAAIFIPRALVMTGAWGWQVWILLSAWDGAGLLPTLPAYPELGAMDLIGLLLALLGMAGIRHRETMHGKARETPVGAPKAMEQEAP